jgi:hypothetical protein
VRRFHPFTTPLLEKLSARVQPSRKELFPKGDFVAFSVFLQLRHTRPLFPEKRPFFLQLFLAAAAVRVLLEIMAQTLRESLARLSMRRIERFLELFVSFHGWVV